MITTVCGKQIRNNLIYKKNIFLIIIKKKSRKRNIYIYIYIYK